MCKRRFGLSIFLLCVTNIFAQSLDGFRFGESNEAVYKKLHQIRQDSDSLWQANPMVLSLQRSSENWTYYFQQDGLYSVESSRIYDQWTAAEEKQFQLLDSLKSLPIHLFPYKKQSHSRHYAGLMDDRLIILSLRHLPWEPFYELRLISRSRRYGPTLSVAEKIKQIEAQSMDCLPY